MGVFLSNSFRKRKRLDLDTKEVMQKIKNLNLEDLSTPGKRTELPFPGLGDPGDRPGRNISFIGTEDVSGLCEKWADGHIVLIGAKGSGKSCRLRAVACYLLQSGEKVVAIWNMTRARTRLPHAMKEALLFAYVDGTVEELARINSIERMEDVKRFVETEHERGIRFTFIFDGVEAWDSKTAAGDERPSASTWEQNKFDLEEYLLKHHVLWGISPRAGMVADLPTRVNEAGYSVDVYHVYSGFAKEMYEEYMRTSLLGHLRSLHQEDMDYYAGNHPWLLDVLSECCRRVLDHWFPWCKDENLDEQAKLIEDEVEWRAVCDSFEKFPEIKAIWSSSVFDEVAKRKKWELPCYSHEKMAEYDPRYVYANSDKYPAVELSFCSPFIEFRYVEEFRRLEKGHCSPDLARWVGYCEVLIESADPILWSEAGLVVERIASYLFAHRGFTIVEPVLNIGRLHRVDFNQPGLGGSRSNANAYPGGYYYMPLKGNYPHIDGLVFWRDSSGQKHLFALQFTLSLQPHIHSADEFMALGVVGEWIPDVLKSSRDGDWKLHFVFVSNESREMEEKEAVNMDVAGIPVGTVSYSLHCLTFVHALKGRVDASVIQVFHDIVERREAFKPDASPRFKISEPLPISKLMTRAAANRLTRAELEKMATCGGIQDPGKRIYRNKDDLIAGMVALNIIELK